MVTNNKMSGNKVLVLGIRPAVTGRINHRLSCTIYYTYKRLSPWVAMQRLDPDTIMAVLPHVFTNEEGKDWSHGLMYLPEMLYLVYSTRKLQAR